MPPVPVMVVLSVVLVASSAIRLLPPSEIVPPLPASEPTVRLKPLRSKIPPFTVSAPIVGSAVELPSRKVPADTVVPPV